MYRSRATWIATIWLSLTTTALAKTFVYISVAGEKRIAVYHMDEKTGALQHRHDVRTSGEPGALTTDPGRRFLFAALRSTGHISSFQIDGKNGALKPVNTGEAGADPAFVATDQTGKYLMSAYYKAGKVVVHRIGPDGSISPKPVQTLKTDEKAHAILTDATNQFVFVPHTGPNAIFQFQFDASSGRLTPNKVPRITTGVNTGPRHLAFLLEHPVVYFDNEQGSSVTAFHLNLRTGTLSPFQTLPTIPKGWKGRNSCARLEITPDGKFLYAANRGHDSIAGFATNATTGRLTALGQTATEATPRSFSIDPGGQFLFAAGQKSDKLAAYRIDGKTGFLHRKATYSVGKRPWWVMAIKTKN